MARGENLMDARAILDLDLDKMVADAKAFMANPANRKVRRFVGRTFDVKVRFMDGETKEFHNLGEIQAKRIGKKYKDYNANAKVDIIETSTQVNEIVSGKIKTRSITFAPAVHKPIFKPEPIVPEKKDNIQETFAFELFDVIDSRGHIVPREATYLNPNMKSEKIAWNNAIVRSNEKMRRRETKNNGEETTNRNLFEVHEKGKLIFGTRDEAILVKWLKKQRNIERFVFFFPATFVAQLESMKGR